MERVTYRGRVIEADEETFTVLTEVDHVEFYVDIETRHLPDVEAGDIVDLHSDHVTRVDLGVWTQEQIDEIKRKGAEEFESIRPFIRDE